MTNPHDLSWALSTIKRIATVEERERIIELLAEELTCLCDLGKSNAIALIKGENK